MNIWIVNQYAKSPNEPGGSRHFSIARELQKRGHKVSIIASSFNHSTRTEAKNFARGEKVLLESIDGVKFCWIETVGYHTNGFRRIVNMLGFAASIYRNLPRKKLDLPDVIVASSPQLFAASASLELGQRHRIPVVAEVRDLWPDTLIELGSLRRWSPVAITLRFLERRLYRRARRVITLLPESTEYISKIANHNNVVTIPNGVNMDKLVKTSVPGNIPRRVIYTGTHGYANGLHLILEAISRVNELDPGVAEFHFYGDGPHKENLRKQAEAMSLENVTFHNPVSSREIRRVQQSADILISTLLPSNLWAFGLSPNKIFDYLAAARPVIFGVNQENNAVTKAGAGVTVDPSDVESFAATIIEYARKSDADLSAIGEKGFDYVKTTHAYSILANSFERALNDALGGA